MAALSADAFYNAAQQFISKGPKHRAEFAEYAIKNMGEVIASATNLALAIELYTKGLLLHHKIPAPQIHKLSELFAALPKGVREKVAVEYERLLAPGIPEGQAVSVTLRSFPQGSAPEPAKQGVKVFKDVIAVLERSSDAFATWRYFFEVGDKNSRKQLTYEFHHLSAIAKALRTQMVISLAGSIASPPQ
ncbi:MAG: hypothetical protein ACXWCY_10010 [Burkholderiales bacterium]